MGPRGFLSLSGLGFPFLDGRRVPRTAIYTFLMFAKSVPQTVIECPVSGVGLISVPDPLRTFNRAKPSAMEFPRFGLVGDAKS
jgi:hypothetical protein